MSKLELLTPGNSTLILIDHQPRMMFGVSSIDRQLLINNVVGLAKAAKVFDVPVILTTVETKSFSGYTWPQIVELFPDQAAIERTSMNSWEDPGFRAEVERIGRKKLVIAALWTEVCLAYPALEAVRDGYEVYAVADASGGTSTMAHDMAMQRMIQADVIPVTWQQVMLEWQRDWARKETYDGIMEIAKAHSGAYGSGVEYAYTLVHGQAPSVPTPEPVKMS
jgi:nicotinamidase-related amidase